jgi:F-type H+-transporting ATPase subunit a
MAHEAEATLTVGQRVKEALAFKTIFTVHIGTLTIPVSETVVTTWIVMFILIVGSLLLTRNMRTIPKGPQLVVETLVGFLNDFFKNQIGHHWKLYAPYLGTIGLFLAVSNVISFFSPLAGFGFEPPFSMKPPTRDINVTAALALMTIVLVIFSGIFFKGIKTWIKSFVKPAPFMLPFNILEYGIKPLSLCLRLFGNILGAFIIMELIGMLIPVFIPPIFSLHFDFFDGLIQAVVFVFLSTLYISEAVE